MVVAENFAINPKDARRLFLAACVDARLTVTSFESTSTSKDGSPIHIDVTHAGPLDAPTAIVICPGTNRAEGLCASGIQTTMLRMGLHIELTSNIALVLVHTATPAIFPSHRNQFSSQTIAIKTKWDNTLLAAAEARYSQYQQQELQISPKDQDHHEWCKQVIANVTEKYLSNADNIVFIEVQTGSGPYGEAETVSCHLPGSDEEKRAIAFFGARTPAEGLLTSNRQGPLVRRLSSSVLHKQITSVFLEFGCYSLSTVLDSLLTRHDNSNIGIGGVDGLYYPNSRDWRNLVWNGAANILQFSFNAIGRAKFK